MDGGPPGRQHALRIPVILLLITAVGTGARCGDPLLTAGDLQGLTVKTTSTYEGKALYGYIDGGADVYREYGFVRLTVQALSLEGVEFSAETYRMSDDSAAFGIFSISVPEDQHSLGPNSAVTPYQSLFASGPYFIRIVNYSGTDRSSALGARIASAMLRRSGSAPFQIPEVLRRVPEITSQVRYVRGPLGIQNGSPEWSEPLEGLDPYSGYLVSGAGDTVRIALMRFSMHASADEFLRRLGGLARHAERKGDSTEVIVVDGPESLRAVMFGPR